MAKEKGSPPQDISFSKLAETSPAALTKLNKDGRFVYANKKTEEVLGLKESEITDRTYDNPAWKITDFEGNDFSQDQLPSQRAKKTEELEGPELIETSEHLNKGSGRGSLTRAGS